MGNIRLAGNMGFGSMRNSSNTKLLIHSDTTDASTTFTDSASTHTVTPDDDAQHDTAQQKWGKTSMLFDGSDHIAVTDHADFNFGTGAFTIDFWVRFADVAAAQGMFQQYEGGTKYVTLWWNSSGTQLNFNFVDGGTVIAMAVSWTPSADTWYHIAIIRGWGGASSGFVITIDGVSVVTSTDADSWSDISATFDIGVSVNTAIFLRGHVDEFRVVKGEAMWTTNFITPMGPYS